MSPRATAERLAHSGERHWREQTSPRTNGLIFFLSFFSFLSIRESFARVRYLRSSAAFSTTHARTDGPSNLAPACPTGCSPLAARPRPERDHSRSTRLAESRTVAVANGTEDRPDSPSRARNGCLSIAIVGLPSPTNDGCRCGYVGQERAWRALRRPQRFVRVMPRQVDDGIYSSRVGRASTSPYCVCSGSRRRLGDGWRSYGVSCGRVKALATD